MWLTLKCTRQQEVQLEFGTMRTQEVTLWTKNLRVIPGSVFVPSLKERVDAIEVSKRFTLTTGFTSLDIQEADRLTVMLDSAETDEVYSVVSVMRFPSVLNVLLETIVP